MQDASCRMRPPPTKHLLPPIAALLLLLQIVAAAHAGPPLTVYTVNYPLQYFAQRIAGDHARVIFPAPAGEDPAFWRPDAETVNRYQRADLILLNGAGYAKWADNVSLPRFRLVDTSAAFAGNYLVKDKAVTHSHGPGAEHSHTGTAFTTWLDFRQAVLQARAIYDALVLRLPAAGADFEANLSALEADLLALDVAMAEIAAGSPDLPLLASHPVYQYLARRYDLRLTSLVWEPGEDPGEGQWELLEGLLEDTHYRWMIWERMPNVVTRERLEALGVRSLVFSPAASTPGEGDFLGVMRANLENLEAAYRSNAPPGQR